MIITVISGLALLWLIAYLRIKRTRVVLINDLRVIYSKIETQVIVEKVRPDNKLVNLLKGYKNMLKNPDLADIQVMVALSMMLPKHKAKKWRLHHEKYMAAMPQSVRELDTEFDLVIRKLINMSMLKPDFILFAIKMLLKLVAKESLNKLMSIPNRYKDFSLNEVVYINNSMRLTTA
ncbi:hypothetical protein [uncultured Sunxiuqinia sp.]|uniref:hypothetical protein n=1 Tax=uncultured Sunxiuqinia sp. TaxID=1573825 RepID=UPI002AA8CB1F|nr:hypothetical protein [uncultured Sunxiuqinia sp.]